MRGALIWVVWVGRRLWDYLGLDIRVWGWSFLGVMAFISSIVVDFIYFSSYLASELLLA